MRDELNEPLGLKPKPPPLATRLRPLARWGGRLVAAALVVGAGAIYWRVTTPRPAEVATIPFDAIKTVVPTPAPSPTAAAVKVYPPLADGGVSVVRNGAAGGPSGHSPEIIDVAEALGRQGQPAFDRRLTESSKYGLLPRIARRRRPARRRLRPPLRGDRDDARRAAHRGASSAASGSIRRPPRPPSPDCRPASRWGLPPTARIWRKSRRARAARGTKSGCRRRWRGSPAPIPARTPSRPKRARPRIENSLRWLMARFTGYVGVANYLGAKFTADSDAVSPVLAEIARRGLLYLDDGSSALSKVGDLAPGLNLKAGRADVIADGDVDGARSPAPRTSRAGAAPPSSSPAPCR